MSAAMARGPVYQCSCGHEFRVFGSGRHRVYFELNDAALAEPVMSGICPDCRGELPGERAV